MKAENLRILQADRAAGRKVAADSTRKHDAFFEASAKLARAMGRVSFSGRSERSPKQRLLIAEYERTRAAWIASLPPEFPPPEPPQNQKGA